MPSKACLSCGKKRPIFAKSGMCHSCYATSPVDPAVLPQKCSVQKCEGWAQKSHGMCDRHYRRFVDHGTTDKVRKVGRHPEYKNWERLRRQKKLCPEWMNLETFLSAVGQRPSPRHWLERHDEKQAFSPTNFFWRAPLLQEQMGFKTKEERRAYQNATRNTRPNYWRKGNLRRYYGLSEAEYNAMAKRQGNLCAMCGCPETARAPKSGELLMLAVDHCHATEKIRELLCSHHNRMLGYAKDDPKVLVAAIIYLAKHSPDATTILSPAIIALQAAMPVAGSA